MEGRGRGPAGCVWTDITALHCIETLLNDIATPCDDSSNMPRGHIRNTTMASLSPSIPGLHCYVQRSNTSRDSPSRLIPNSSCCTASKNSQIRKFAKYAHDLRCLTSSTDWARLHTLLRSSATSRNHLFELSSTAGCAD